MASLKVDQLIVGGGIVGSYLASRLLSLGHTVGIVETGSASSQSKEPPEPMVHFPERSNLGVINARNHVLSGNSKYWGGGLVRNDEKNLCKMFELDASSPLLLEFEKAYRLVEGRFELPKPSRAIVDPKITDAKVTVLPGRHRDIFSTLLGPLVPNPSLTLLCDSQVISFTQGVDGRIESLQVASRDGKQTDVIASAYVLAMGAVDTNIFALSRLRPLLKETADIVGTRLHDHWSVPIAKIAWKNGAGLDWLFPPTFHGKFVQGVHAEMAAACPWGPQYGFLHLQADYGGIEPYATIRQVLNGQQQGQNLGSQLRNALPIGRHLGRLSKIALDRYLRRRLYVPNGMEVTVYLDFEAYPSERNRFSVHDETSQLFWDIRNEDVIAFSNFLAITERSLSRWASDADLELKLLVSHADVDGTTAYLRTHAVDTYHLGGGLAVSSTPKSGVLNHRFAFHEIQNLSAIGTATFAAAGVANPVETLLASCELYCSSLNGRVS